MGFGGSGGAAEDLNERDNKSEGFTGAGGGINGDIFVGAE